MDEKKRTQPRANYYRRKTKDYFEELGYHCEYAERYLIYFDRKRNKTGFQKSDLFAADFIAKNERETLYVNSVVNRSNISEHIKRFNRYKWPGVRTFKVSCPACLADVEIKVTPTERPLIVVWTPRVGEPDIVEVPIEQG